MVAVRSEPVPRPALAPAGAFDEGRDTLVFKPPMRRDALPEHTRYADTGCSVHPSCLSCPLVRCRFDEPDGGRGASSRDRDLSILRVRREERLTIEAVARRFSVSRRTVFRVLARARDEEAATWR